METEEKTLGLPEVPPPPERPSTRRKIFVPVLLIGLCVVILAAGGFLVLRMKSRSQQTAAADQPKAVTVVTARPATYHPTRRYVGRIEPWLEAKIGPQFVSAYVKEVRFRPGAAVLRAQVVATLDCSNVTADREVATMRARAHEVRQKALAHEGKRLAALVKRGFVSENEVEQKMAQSASEQAEHSAAKAWEVTRQLQVSDCILRAPFSGEVSERLADPGAFARPGGNLLTVVDRRKVRITAEIPERDFDLVAPGTELQLRLLALGKTISARVARRSPAADLSTRTVRIEVDLPNRNRQIPVGTTAELFVDVGRPVPATQIPLSAAIIQGDHARVFVVEGEVARQKTLPVLGEHEGALFLNPSFPAGSRVVTEGRALLQDGDPVRP
jgi:RND family efflux transporter MFP subunit